MCGLARCSEQLQPALHAPRIQIKLDDGIPLPHEAQRHPPLGKTQPQARDQEADSAGIVSKRRAAGTNRCGLPIIRRGAIPRGGIGPRASATRPCRRRLNKLRQFGQQPQHQAPRQLQHKPAACCVLARQAQAILLGAIDQIESTYLKHRRSSITPI